MDDTFDVIVVGVGIFGLQAARTYLDLHPEAKLLALEAYEHAGGVWGKSRWYPGFWTQGGYGLMEWSDRPFGDLPKDHNCYLFKAEYVIDYIEKYLDSHVYNGKSLRDRIRCSFSVDSVSKMPEGLWSISGHSNKPNEPQETTVYKARKVMIASGFTSIPSIPNFKNDNFSGRIIHSSNFGREADTILATAPKKHISVLGGGKSAADMVYAAAKAGHDVNWIIRKHGSGPGLFAVPSKMGKYNNPTEIMMTRAGTTLSPSHFGKPNLWTRFVHGTWLGRWLLLNIFHMIGQDSIKKAGFDSNEKALEGFNKMKPEANEFWLNAAVGMVQVEDFWPTIAEKVHVYRNDISHLASDGIHLEDGPVIPCDIFLLGTGFKEEYPFFDAAEHTRLGLSHPPTSNAEQDEWLSLQEEADKEIISRFPMLARGPGFQKTPRVTPFRLYNAIASLSDPTIVFLGCVSLVNMFAGAEWQALWASAYLDGNIELPSKEEMKKQIAMDNQWSRRRYPFYGETSGICFDMECVLYGDRLLKELGCTSHIDGLSGWQYWTKVNFANQYKGVMGEYVANLKKQN
ncbi:FAD/NAD(P)-binding domain-containing protein [Rhizodiscina lignyota]|uniref:L-ornithine N(5)-monooxygenase [NAD(P)H] n=1 Tax=Rhizodiscina lignyota TaxID=1504668 RepID=A0A9P4INJ8_9PEZI|nr:FAD/NAD(P)-binding domain-containing protein [Rhizodiscina lignyota]